MFDPASSSRWHEEGRSSTASAPDVALSSATRVPWLAPPRVLPNRDTHPARDRRGGVARRGQPRGVPGALRNAFPPSAGRAFAAPHALHATRASVLASSPGTFQSAEHDSCLRLLMEFGATCRRCCTLLLAYPCAATRRRHVLVRSTLQPPPGALLISRS